MSTKFCSAGCFRVKLQWVTKNVDISLFVSVAVKIIQELAIGYNTIKIFKCNLLCLLVIHMYMMYQNTFKNISIVFVSDSWSGTTSADILNEQFFSFGGRFRIGFENVTD